MTDDDLARIRADFETLKTKLKASVDQLDPERYNRITAKLVALDKTTIRERIEQRRGSHRVEKLMAEIEGRLRRAEGNRRD